MLALGTRCDEGAEGEWQDTIRGWWVHGGAIIGSNVMISMSG